MTTSVFTRPRARSRLAAVSSSQNRIDVYTRDELLAALTSIPRADGNCYGRSINIVGDIVLDKPVQLLTQHTGLLITSSSNARISTSSALTQAFSVAASGVTIERLVLASGFSATSFVRQFSDRLNVSRISILSGSVVANLVKNVSGAQLYIDGCRVQSGGPSVSLYDGISGGTPLFDSSITNNVLFSGGIANSNFNRSVVSGNIALGGLTTTSSASTSALIVSGNVFSGSISILGASSVRISIFGNSMSNQNIDTSGSGGSNSIVGNTNVGTIFSASTDAVTSNT